MGKGVASLELGCRGGIKGHRGSLASIEEQRFTGEGVASSELGCQGCECAVNKLIDEGVDPMKALSELLIRSRAKFKIAGTCKYPGGCTLSIRSGYFCNIHMPVKPEKSDECRRCGQVFRVREKVVGGVCNPCYQKPEAVAACRHAIAEKKDDLGTCSTPGCTGINHRGTVKCQRCLIPRKSK